MKNRNVLWWILILGFLNRVPQVSAQQPQTTLEKTHLQDHKPLMNQIWETFDTLMYKVTNEKGRKVYTPYFPPQLASLEGKSVQLKGYMVSMQTGFRHNLFMLSVLPIHQCMFCGQDNIPALVDIVLHEGKKERISDHSVTVKRITFLNRDDRKRLEIRIVDALINKN